MRKNVWCLSFCDWITPANFLNKDNWKLRSYETKRLYTAKETVEWRDSLQNGRKHNLKNAAIKPKREFSKQGIQMSIKYFKNMFNILSHVEMQNDYFEIPCHPNQNGNHWEIKTANVGENVGKKELLLTVGKNGNWYYLHGKQCEATQQARNKITMWTKHTATKGSIFYYWNIWLSMFIDALIHNI